MPILRCNGKLILFVHIPKTGGSTIEAYLRLKGKVAFLEPRPSSGVSCTGQHFHADIYNSLFPRSFFDEIFCVIRDPVDRLRSEYKYRARPASARQRLRSFRFSSGRMSVQVGHRRVCANFDEWVQEVLKAYELNTFINDNHIRPQADFIIPGSKVFAFSGSFSRIFEWIDMVSCTAALEAPDRLKQSAKMDVSASNKTIERIHAFYYRDYEILKRLEAETSDGSKRESK